MYLQTIQVPKDEKQFVHYFSIYILKFYWTVKIIVSPFTEKSFACASIAQDGYQTWVAKNTETYGHTKSLKVFRASKRSVFPFPLWKRQEMTSFPYISQVSYTWILYLSQITQLYNLIVMG